MQKIASRQPPASPVVHSPATPSPAAPDDAATALISEIHRLAKAAGRDGSADLTRACHEALRMFPKEAYRHGILQPLWAPHYERLRQREKELVEALEDKVPPAREAFNSAAHSAKRHLVELQGIVAPKGNTSFGRQLLYKLQVFSGDVERYEERNAPPAAGLLASQHSDMTDCRAAMSCRTFSRCIGTYIAASKLLPQNGLAYNQLGVTYEAKRDAFLATYFYARAAFAEQKPFERAPESLARVLAATAADDALRGDPVQEIFFAARNVLSAAFVANDAEVKGTEGLQQFQGVQEGLGGAPLPSAVVTYVDNASAVFSPKEMILERLVLLLVTAAVNGSGGALDALLAAVLAVTQWAAALLSRAAPAQGSAKEATLGSAIAAAELCLRWASVGSTSVIEQSLGPNGATGGSTERLFRQLCEAASSLLRRSDGECGGNVALGLLEDEEILGLRSFTGNTASWGKMTTSLSVTMSDNPLLLGKEDAAGVSASEAIRTRLARVKLHLERIAARWPAPPPTPEDEDEVIVYDHRAHLEV